MRRDTLRTIRSAVLWSVLAGGALMVGRTVATFPGRAMGVVAAVLVVPLVLEDLRKVRAGAAIGALVPVYVMAGTVVRWLSLPFASSYTSGGTLWIGGGLVLGAAYWGALDVERRRQALRRGQPLGVLLVALCGMALLSQSVGGDVFSLARLFTDDFSVLYLIGGLVAFGLTCLCWESAAAGEDFMVWMAVAGVVHVVVAIEQSTIGTGPFGGALGVPGSGGYVAGAMLDGELTSELIVVMLAWTLCLAVWSKVGSRRRAAGVLAITYLVGVLTMSHRAAFLGGIGVLAGVVLVALTRSRISAFLRTLGVVASAALLVVVVGLFGLDVLALSNEGVRRFMTMGVSLGEGLNRGPLYAQAFAALSTLPPTGLGMGHAATLVRFSGEQYSSTHSVWLWALLSMGWAGLAIVVVLMSTVVVRAVQAYRGAFSAAGAATLLTAVFLVIDQSKVDFARRSVYVFFFFAVLGVVSSMYANRRADEVSE